MGTAFNPAWLQGAPTLGVGMGYGGSGAGFGAGNPIFDMSGYSSLQLPTTNMPPVTGPQTTSIGWNAPTAMAAFQGLQTLGNLWQGFQANKLAKRAFNFQKDFANTNLRNQTQEYNTSMADRVASRQAVYAGSANAMSPEQANAYLAQNQLRLPASAQLDPRRRG